MTKSYDDLQRWAIKHIINLVGDGDQKKQAIDRARQRFTRRIRRYLSRTEYLISWRAKTPLEILASDVFLTSRLGELNSHFLNLQEGSTEDFRSRAVPNVGEAIALLGRGLGRKPLGVLNCRLRWGNRTLLQLSLDPFPHLRVLYGLEIAGPNLLKKFMHMAAYKLKLACAGVMLRHLLRRAMKARHPLDFVNLPPFRFFLEVVSDFHAKEKSRDRKFLTEVAANTVPFLNDFGVQLLFAIGSNPNALAKFFKMVVAVVVWRGLACQERGLVTSSFVSDTIRLAVAWASTYPLVDDELDSAATTVEQRRRIGEVISHFVTGSQDFRLDLAQADRLVLLQRAFSIITEIPSVDLQSTRQAIYLVSEAHLADSARRIDSTLSLSDDLFIYVDSHLKSFLVRLATATLCGVELSAGDLNRATHVALFNQLGDDLCDIDEDLYEKRVTPFTLFWALGNTINPYECYQKSIFHILKLEGDERADAALYSAVETLTTAWDQLGPMNQKRCEPHFRNLSFALTGVSEFPIRKGVFFIDPDNLLVKFFEALVLLMPQRTKMESCGSERIGAA